MDEGGEYLCVLCNLTVKQTVSILWLSTKCLAQDHEMLSVPSHIILTTSADICVIISILYVKKQSLRKANNFAQVAREQAFAF